MVSHDRNQYKFESGSVKQVNRTERLGSIAVDQCEVLTTAVSWLIGNPILVAVPER